MLKLLLRHPHNGWFIYLNKKPPLKAVNKSAEI